MICQMYQETALPNVMWMIQRYICLFAAVNEDLHNWCFHNGLLLNPEKAKLIVYGGRQMLEKLPEFHISLLGKELVPADFVKDLGVTFDKYSVIVYIYTCSNKPCEAYL